MPIDQERRRTAFQKLDRQLSKLAKKTAPNSIHKFRTYSRRVEALIDQLVPEPSRNDRKLLKVLGRIRKKAGRVRDLDVQMSSLRSLKIPEDATRKSQLLTRLAEERQMREEKLSEVFDKETVHELRRRLQRAAQQDGIPGSLDPLAVAVNQFGELTRNEGSLTEKRLHQYRIVGKRARYLGEFAGKNPDAKAFVDRLKRMQDAIGDWHDWLKLTERAEEIFAHSHNSALLSLLRNVTRAKFRQAVIVLTETQSAFLGDPSASEPPLPKKPVQIQQMHAAAA